MTHRVILTIALLLLAGNETAALAQSAGYGGACTISAHTPRRPGDYTYEVYFQPAEGAKRVASFRAQSLVEAVHYVQSERTHGGCKALPSWERGSCSAFRPNQGGFVLTYAQSKRHPQEGLAFFSTFESLNRAAALLRQSYLCN